MGWLPGILSYNLIPSWFDFCKLIRKFVIVLALNDFPLANEFSFIFSNNYGNLTIYSANTNSDQNKQIK